MKKIILLLAIAFSIAFKHSESVEVKTVVNLHDNWTFKQEGNSTWKPATVPGVVHLDLLHNGMIEDPYWEDNELKLRWIENDNWIYKTSFTIDENSLQRENIELNFKGLDTYAEVYLNASKIISADNMFRTWSASIKPYLKLGKNELKVVFTSPIQKNKKLIDSYPYVLPSGNEPQEIETKVAAFTRKAAYQFGWDWGPRFVTSGIFRPVELITWNKARLIDVFTSTEAIKKDSAYMKTTIEVEVNKAGSYELHIGEHKSKHFLKSGFNQIEHSFTVFQPKLWWTNGKGASHLYKENVKLFSNEQLLDTFHNAYGIRTIELINQPDSIGTSFYFKLNGQALFMKGANYIPQDVFLPRVKPIQYETLIQAARDANFNMIRVWGGGIYESDLFYDLCDKNGILIWQDFMFANSLYPSEADFKENIKAEVIENIKRIRKHPCLALWCGNNEIEVAWQNWGWQNQYGYSPQDSIEIWHNYKSIFHDLIPSLVGTYDPNTPFTTTSPLSNWGTVENFNHSSMHYWGVWHGKEPFENFKNNVGRFVSEYGFQSFPSIKTLRTVVSENQLSLDSEMITHRQKSYIGNGMILKHIEQYYSKPKNFEAFVLLSQYVQAKGMEMAINAHLGKQPHCMGTLFWQFNDCWPGPSWSVMDYYGNKKVAYDVVKKAYATQ